jgi:hypothetical protein
MSHENENLTVTDGITYKLKNPNQALVSRIGKGMNQKLTKEQKREKKLARRKMK